MGPEQWACLHRAGRVAAHVGTSRSRLLLHSTRCSAVHYPASRVHGMPLGGSDIMGQQQTCIDCGERSPSTETNYTLISAAHGWRLTRFRGDDGQFVVHWRCPRCWEAYKKNRGQPSASMRAAQVVDEPDRPGRFFAEAARRLRRGGL